MSKTVKVAAAVIERGGDVLVCSRPDGDAMCGKWEFPGGKLEPGESFAEALRRELSEELAIADVTVLDTLGRAGFCRPDKTVVIRFLRCRLPESQTITPLEGQKFRWVGRRELRRIDFLPADRDFVIRLSGF